MKIISCQIENFGKLSHKKVYFTEGLNVRVGENGHGKSTLAAFIRVMLYGFQGESKRNNIDNERKKFKPWQGGVYGGEMTFESQGKVYIVTRIFGDKASEDDFLVRDQKTGLPVDDFTQNLGEELFEIDGDSFLRTVFISQNDCETKATGSISAKLGNLAMATGDIDTFEQVDKKLSDLENNLSKTRKTGQIYKKKHRASELAESIRRKPTYVRTVEELKETRDEKAEERDRLLDEQNNIKNKLAKLSAEKDKQVVKKQFEDLRDNLSERKETYDTAMEAFPAGVPETAEIDRMLNATNRMAELEGVIAGIEPSKEQKRIFGEHLATGEEIERFIKNWNERNARAGGMASKRASLETLENVVRTEEMQQAQRELFNKKKQDRREKRVKENELARSRKKRNGIISIIVGVLLLIIVIPAVYFVKMLDISGTGLLVTQTALAVGLSCLGLMFLISGILAAHYARIAGPDHNIEEDEQMILSDSREKLQQLYEELSKDCRFIEKVDEDARAFCERISMSYDEYSFLGVMQDLRNSERSYRENINRYEAARKEYDSLSGEKEHFLAKYKLTASSDFASQMLDIKEKAITINATRSELQNAEDKMSTFLDTNDETVFDTDEVAEEFSVEELSDQLSYLTGQINEVSDLVRDYTEKLNRAYEELDNIQEDEVTLEQLNEEIAEDEHKLKIITLTHQMLSEAKVTFTQKYMQPLMDGFSKYYNILTETDPESYNLDANMDITVKEAGKPRDIKTLSQGCRDLVGICMRLALVSAMYSHEKPIIILDDPFVNLDTVKAGHAKTLLGEIAKNYQVIYFTCHTSRT